MEAAAWDAAGSWQLLWERSERLLPEDPWETVYFKANAPWTSASPSLEIQRTLIQAAQDGGGKARQWEAISGAWANWVLRNFGRRGVEAFWRARSWTAAAKELELEPQDLAVAWEQHLTQALEALEGRGVGWGLLSLRAGSRTALGRPYRGFQKGSRSSPC